jgi:hypothetical protein
MEGAASATNPLLVLDFPQRAITGQHDARRSSRSATGRKGSSLVRLGRRMADARSRRSPDSGRPGAGVADALGPGLAGPHGTRA